MSKITFEERIKDMKMSLDKSYGKDNMQSLLLVWVLAQHELYHCLNEESGVEAYIQNMRENKRED